MEPIDLMEQHISELTNEIVKFVAVVEKRWKYWKCFAWMWKYAETINNWLSEVWYIKLATEMLTAEFHISHNLRY